MILVSILVLGILIFVHELGHFLVAKWNNVGVIEFAIGFGKVIYQRQIGETKYSLRLIPLGGFVRMVGDDPRQLVLNEMEIEAGESATQQEVALIQDRSRWFLSKGYWAKFWVVLAGPLFNIIFAYFLSVYSFAVYGKPLPPLDIPVIGDVVPGNPADKAGIKAKDLIKSINGRPISTWKELSTIISESEGKEMEIVVERDAATQSGSDAPARESIAVKVTANSDMSELDVITGGEPKKVFRIGIFADSPREPIGLGEAVILGGQSIWQLSKLVVKSLGAMVRGLVSPKNISGPIGILGAAARSARDGIEKLLSFMIFLSVTLAIMNLLPIPILDGGHLTIFTIEALKGSPLSLKVQEFATQVGMFLLLLLTVFAFGNDLLQIEWGKIFG